MISSGIGGDDVMYCPICFLEYGSMEMLIFNCGHGICQYDGVRYIEFNYDKRSTPEGLKCPMSGCGVRIPDEIIDQTINTAIMDVEPSGGDGTSDVNELTAEESVAYCCPVCMYVNIRSSSGNETITCENPDCR
jgi:hypothetical protein